MIAPKNHIGDQFQNVAQNMNSRVALPGVDRATFAAKPFEPAQISNGPQNTINMNKNWKDLSFELVLDIIMIHNMIITIQYFEL